MSDNNCQRAPASVSLLSYGYRGSRTTPRYSHDRGMKLLNEIDPICIPKSNAMCQRSGRYEINERGHPDEEWKTTSELKIRRLEKTDLGEYTCSASSSMGKAEATLRVYGEFSYHVRSDGIHRYLHLYVYASLFDTRHSVDFAFVSI